MSRALAATVTLAATLLAANAHAFPKIDADTYCGEDGNAYVSWSVDSYDIWSSAGENEDVLIEIKIDGGEWVEVDRGAFVAPEFHFEGSTALPDGSLTVIARAWALAPWGNGWPADDAPRYADRSWQGEAYATVFDVPTDCGAAPPPGVAPARFWRKNTSFWPGATVAAGGQSYTITEGVDLIKTKAHRDKTYKMTRQVIAAQLNVDEGNDSSCITTELADAHTWLTNNPPGSDVRGCDPAWRNEGKALMKKLREYNRGELCVTPRIGVAGPRYWKNHSSDWPMTSITLGDVSYTQTDIIDNMMIAGHGDRSYRMAKVLAATELNIALGNDGSCVATVVADAQAWLINNPVGSSVRGKDAAWQNGGKMLIHQLRDYNRGRMCAPHR